MIFTNQEMAAILRMAQVIANADGKVTNEEMALMALELARFGVTQEKSKLIILIAQELEASDAVLIIARMNHEEKRYVTAYLGTMICADGNIDKKELILWASISEICNLPQMSIKEAIEYMKNI